MNAAIMRVLAGVIYLSAVALAVLGGLAFYVNPAYEKGVWAAVEAFKDVLLVAVGVKGGAMVASVPPAPTPSAPPAEPRP
jgi:hypothetical protein